MRLDADKITLAYSSIQGSLIHIWQRESEFNDAESNHKTNNRNNDKDSDSWKVKDKGQPVINNANYKR